MFVKMCSSEILKFANEVSKKHGKTLFRIWTVGFKALFFARLSRFVPKRTYGKKTTQFVAVH
jgi:hypothetical protein